LQDNGASRDVGNIRTPWRYFTKGEQMTIQDIIAKNEKEFDEKFVNNRREDGEECDIPPYPSLRDKRLKSHLHKCQEEAYEAGADAMSKNRDAQLKAVEKEAYKKGFIDGGLASNKQGEEIAYEAGRKAERERCAEIARSGVVAQAWTTERNEKKVMDPELAIDAGEAIAKAIKENK
jgi:hypothetical protein